MTHIVLVHGAWHGSWCWSMVADKLRPLGHTVTAVDLHRGTLAGDTQAVQEAIDNIGTPAIVCGHSYGGAVITGLRPELIRHAIYLAAIMPDATESVLSIMGGSLSAVVDLREDGASCVIAPDTARTMFFGDCDIAVQNDAIVRLVPQQTRHFADPPGRALWRDIPTTYVVCTDDKAIAPDQQVRMSQQATYSQSWPTSHSPFLSSPERVADVLAELAR
ncbi:alpha/beta fold hydrolase [Nocardia vinacea]|uniref:Alpha/beta fold hydrolase n=1 Tax=Nocardia vinacea TaxID=96468 RepID=A0ABZ1YTM0_9NOCA|nr:alpha/beta fold hydrolase [Nocardia vinacea]